MSLTSFYAHYKREMSHTQQHLEVHARFGEHTSLRALKHLTLSLHFAVEIPLVCVLYLNERSGAVIKEKKNMELLGVLLVTGDVRAC